MLIQNNLPTVLDFGNPPHGTKLHDPGGPNAGVKLPGFSLKPGINEVDSEAWEMWTTGRAKSVGADGKPAGLNWHIQEKNVEVVKVESESKSGQVVVNTVDAGDFAELNADDAIDLVRDTFDIKMLEAWGEAESEGKDRKTVMAAIIEQVTILEAEVAGTDHE